MKKSVLLLLMVILLIVPAAFADGPIEGRAGRAEVRFLEGMIDHHQMAIDMATHCLDKASTEEVRTLCQNVIDAQTGEIDIMRGWLVAWYNIDYTPMPMHDMMHAMEMMSMMETMPMADMMSMMEGMDMGEMSMHEMMTHMMEMGMMGEGHGGMMGGEHGAPGGEHQQHGAAATAEPTAEAEHDAHHPATAEPTAEPAAPTGEHQHGGTTASGMITDMPMMMGMMAGLDRLEGIDYDLAWLEAMIDHHDDALHMSERILEVAEHDALRSLAEQIIADQTAEIEAMEALIAELSAQ